MSCSFCHSCGAPLPPDQGSNVCSMCYGDPFHGKDGYYLERLEYEYEQQRLEEEANRCQVK